MLGQLNCINPSPSRSGYVTHWRCHKLKMDSLLSNLTDSSFVSCHGNTVVPSKSKSDINDLLDKQGVLHFHQRC